MPQQSLNTSQKMALINVRKRLSEHYLALLKSEASAKRLKNQKNAEKNQHHRDVDFLLFDFYLMMVPAFSKKASFAATNDEIIAVLPGFSLKNLTQALTFGYMLPLAK